MKVLYWHVESLEVWNKSKALRSADDLNSDEMHKKFENGVVALITLEQSDDQKPELLERFANDLKAYMEQIKANKVFLYPYAHLSSNLLHPQKSKEIFAKTISYLKDQGIDVDYAAFGWYKEFKVHVKGHPLAELSRVF